MHMPLSFNIKRQTNSRSEQVDELIAITTPVTITHDPRTRLPPGTIYHYPRKQRRIHGSYVGEQYNENFDPPFSSFNAKEEKEKNERMLEFYQARMEVAETRKAQEASAKALIAQVAAAAAAEEAAAAAALAEAKKKAEESAAKVEHWKERAARKKMLTPEEKEKNKEKRLMKLVGAVVVKCLSKYSKQFDRDAFKKHAKEVRTYVPCYSTALQLTSTFVQLTQIISDKEKKSSNYRDNKLDGLSEEKEVKIKKFAKEYIAKVIRKIEKLSKRPQASTSLSASTANNTPSTSMTTPNSNDGGDSRHRDNAMSVEEAMGMEPNSDSEGEGDDEDVEDKLQTGYSNAMLPPRMPSRMFDGYFEREDDSMEMDDGRLSSTDPRRRHYTDIY